MTRTAVIMQPTYLPWLGYFDLLDQCDVFVFYDDAEFSKQSWHQRNRIRTSKGLEWLTVPVSHKGRGQLTIRDAEITPDRGFPRDHIRAIELNYQKSRAFERNATLFRETLEESASLNLGGLNMRLIRAIARELGMEKDIRLTSELGAEGKRSALMVDICRIVGAGRCLSPLGSAGYLRNEFDPIESDVELVFQQFEHPEYRQCFEPFIPHASVLDLMFNEGKGALEVIRSGRRETLSAAEGFATVDAEG